MRKLLWVMLVLAFLALSGVCYAAPFTVVDTTWVKTQNGDWYGPSGDTAIGGSNYNTSKVVIDQVGGNLVFSFYTEFDNDDPMDGYFQLPGTNVHTYLADLALDTDGDGSFDKGVVLKDHAEWTQGTLPGNSYGIGLYDVSSWNTSSDFMEGISGIIYGEEWAAEQTGTLQDSVVAISDGSFLGDAMVSWADDVWSVSIGLADLGVSGGDLGFFWGTASCGNDPISGTVHVPEPGTLLFLSSFIAGLGVVGRKKLMMS